MSNDLEQYNEKKVLVTVAPKDGADAYEIEGTVSVGNDLGLLIKPKGKTQLLLIEAAEIVEVKYVLDKPKDLKAKELKPVEFGSVRQHLLDRHGFSLADINSRDEAWAFEFHNEIDHKAADLGHVHVAKEATPVGEAVAEAEAVSTEA